VRLFAHSFGGHKVNERPCICNGNSDNCRYCFGRGYVPTGKVLPSRKSTGGIRPGGRSDKPKTKANKAGPTIQSAVAVQSEMPDRVYTTCLKCGAVLRQSRVEGHRTRCPARGAKELSRLTSIASNAVSETRAKSQTLKLSVSRAHPKVQLPPRRDPKSIVECPGCHARVKSKDVTTHKKQCPRLRKILKTIRKRQRHPISVSARIPPSRERGVPPASPEGRKQRSYEQVSGRDRLDKSKGYAHPYRETGRFGSHPIHDGFDDESGPS
jgi:hypothetical protein